MRGYRKRVGRELQTGTKTRLQTHYWPMAFQFFKDVNKVASVCKPDVTDRNTNTYLYIHTCLFVDILVPAKELARRRNQPGISGISTKYQALRTKGLPCIAIPDSTRKLHQ
jgi:hypothetical protein